MYQLERALLRYMDKTLTSLPSVTLVLQKTFAQMVIPCSSAKVLCSYHVSTMIFAIIFTFFFGYLMEREDSVRMTWIMLLIALGLTGSFLVFFV